MDHRHSGIGAFILISVWGTMASVTLLCLFSVAASLGFVHGSADVRLVDAAGGLSSVGMLQVRTDAGFGSVCGANAAAADAICLMLKTLRAQAAP